jgi:hypothetical protein
MGAEQLMAVLPLDAMPPVGGVTLEVPPVVDLPPVGESLVVTELVAPPAGTPVFPVVVVLAPPEPVGPLPPTRQVPVLPPTAPRDGVVFVSEPVHPTSPIATLRLKDCRTIVRKGASKRGITSCVPALASDVHSPQCFPIRFNGKFPSREYRVHADERCPRGCADSSRQQGIGCCLHAFGCTDRATSRPPPKSCSPARSTLAARAWKEVGVRPCSETQDRSHSSFLLTLLFAPHAPDSFRACRFRWQGPTVRLSSLPIILSVWRRKTQLLRRND